MKADMSRPSAISPCKPMKKVTVKMETKETYKMPSISDYPEYDLTVIVEMKVTMLTIKI